LDEPDSKVAWPDSSGDLLGRLWDLDTAAEETAVVPTGDVTSLAFIVASLRRRVWLWGAIAAIGLLVGCGLYVKFPPAYQATVSILLKSNPNEDAVTEAETDAALAASTTVAGRVVHKLGMTQSVPSFQADYTVTNVTSQVLMITVSAPSSAAAVTRASALATVFLQFRAQYAQAQQKQLVTQLNQQFSQAQQHLYSLTEQITQVSDEPRSPAQQAELSSLEAQRGDAGQVEQYVTGTKASTQTATQAMVADSAVINAASPLPHSHLKSLLVYVGGGLIFGLALGMGIVIVSALASDRLRRRDDIAEALGAPVRLSIGAVRVPRWLLVLPWLAARRDRDTQRLLTHLRSLVPAGSGGAGSVGAGSVGAGGLVIVAVDNVQFAARTLTSLALSYAAQGQKVVLADLANKAPAAHVLGVRGPGINAVAPDGKRLAVAVPDRDDAAPVGPLPGRASGAELARPGEDLINVYADADVLLALTELEPAFGADHIASWATSVAVLVTAGRSSATRIHAVGEMIRISGVRVVSAIVIGADKRDESIGVAYRREQSALSGPV
jgi:capsular polysaccharide biosynthesis protein